jgi:hypothetical protein
VIGIALFAIGDAAIEPGRGVRRVEQKRAVEIVDRKIGLALAAARLAASGPGRAL